MPREDSATPRPSVDAIDPDAPPKPPKVKRPPRDTSQWPRSYPHYVDVADLMARPTAIPQRAGYTRPEPKPLSKRERMRIPRPESAGDACQRGLTRQEKLRQDRVLGEKWATLEADPDIRALRDHLYEAACLPPIKQLLYLVELQEWLINKHPEKAERYKGFCRDALAFMDAVARWRAA